MPSDREPFNHEERARWELLPDARDQIIPSPCPCGLPVIKVDPEFLMDGIHNYRFLRYWHSRHDCCEFVRRF